MRKEGRMRKGGKKDGGKEEGKRKERGRRSEQKVEVQRNEGRERVREGGTVPQFGVGSVPVVAFLQPILQPCRLWDQGRLHQGEGQLCRCMNEPVSVGYWFQS